MPSREGNRTPPDLSPWLRRKGEPQPGDEVDLPGLTGSSLVTRSLAHSQGRGWWCVFASSVSCLPTHT